jgi:hypothetical protein
LDSNVEAREAQGLGEGNKDNEDNEDNEDEDEDEDEDNEDPPADFQGDLQVPICLNDKQPTLPFAEAEDEVL